MVEKLSVIFFTWSLLVICAAMLVLDNETVEYYYILLNSCMHSNDFNREVKLLVQ